MIIVPKAAAATRQLDVAIDLLLADGDPLAVRTLAAAAAGIFADLNETKVPGSSWRSQMIADAGIDSGKARSILHAAANFLKHADKDPAAILQFDDAENDHLIFVATLECGHLGERLSVRMQTFQIWYLASFVATPSVAGVAKQFIRVLPNLERMTKQQRLAKGREMVNEYLVREAAGLPPFA